MAAAVHHETAVFLHVARPHDTALDSPARLFDLLQWDRRADHDPRAFGDVISGGSPAIRLGKGGYDLRPAVFPTHARGAGIVVCQGDGMTNGASLNLTGAHNTCQLADPGSPLGEALGGYTGPMNSVPVRSPRVPS